MLQFLQLLLLPFSWLYGGIMALRNWLYKEGIFKSTAFRLPVISIGNLAVGGTGKTPHTEYLVRLLQGRKTAILSRGYGRKTKGFVLADSTASAATIGDEPSQYYQNFNEAGVTVAVCENRVTGISRILNIKPGTEVVLLDDAYQHRRVKPSLHLLLTDFNKPFFKDLVLPAGRLREFRSGAKRAGIIFVTKCPEQVSSEMEADYLKQIRRYSRPETPVFFTSYNYQKPVAFGSEQELSKNVVLVTGIANPGPLQQHLQEQGFTVLEHYNFPDHYTYNTSDLERIKAKTALFEKPFSFITTQKDAVKLTEPDLLKISRKLPFFYIPVAVAFLKDQEKFDALIRKAAGIKG